MLSDFRSYQMAKGVYQIAKRQRLNQALRNQLIRASSSIVLNHAEGNDRRTLPDRRKFFTIALTSLREVQAIAEIEDLHELLAPCNRLGGSIYCLIKRLPN